jgi:hypothetical protein
MIFAAGALLALGIAATLVAGRLRVPGLVLFLVLGMALGSDVLNWLDFDDVELASTIGRYCPPASRLPSSARCSRRCWWACRRRGCSTSRR